MDSGKRRQRATAAAAAALAHAIGCVDGTRRYFTAAGARGCGGALAERVVWRQWRPWLEPWLHAATTSGAVAIACYCATAAAAHCQWPRGAVDTIQRFLAADRARDVNAPVRCEGTAARGGRTLARDLPRPFDLAHTVACVYVGHFTLVHGCSVHAAVKQMQ